VIQGFMIEVEVEVVTRCFENCDVSVCGGKIGEEEFLADSKILAAST
jgi:hypothetical protein